MKLIMRCFCLIPIISLAGCACLPESTPRFVLETHDIDPIPEPALFKLDSSSGEVWRYSEGKFIELEKVHAEDFIPKPKKTKEEIESEEHRQAVIDRMNAIRLPDVNFRQTPINIVAETLTRASITNDPGKLGVEIKVATDLERAIKEHSHNDNGSSDNHPDLFGSKPEDYANDEDITLVTFSALDITLREALDIVVDVCNLKWRVTEDGSVLLHIDFGENDAAIYMYSLGAGAKEFLRETNPELLNRWSSSIGSDKNWEKYFSTHGVGWPDGSSIKYVPSIDKLIVHNFPDELAVVEQTLKLLNIGPSRPGRYLFKTTKAQSRALFLFDTITGNVWKYHQAIQLTDGKDMITKESFERIPNYWLGNFK